MTIEWEEDLVKGETTLSTTRRLRLEGLAVLLLVLVGYGASDGSWLLFIALILVPDLAMLGYVAGPEVGARIYNLGHLYVWPATLLGGWLVLEAAGRSSQAWSGGHTSAWTEPSASV